ncbi:unnamed protein product [Notodromas monacha]|uniref:Vacuolar protein sorting-associated protein 53 homolog n=1 Tax=Notodromas monacha TaxID=399045 RepID=A0A7R9BKN1_9CRUS|nr:unnamed protein product [Notodromas monacha]CAG0916149.1 unnamed protein product [Notodromas monacha]
MSTRTDDMSGLDFTAPGASRRAEAVHLPDFSEDDYDEIRFINEHFFNEQSLANIDDVIDELENKIAAYDDSLQKVCSSSLAEICLNDGQMSSVLGDVSVQCEALFRFGIDDELNARKGKLIFCSFQVVRQQIDIGKIGEETTSKAVAGIEELMTKTASVMTQIRESEEMVEHITAEIKAFDRAKRNLNTSILTLNRLNMLSGGLNQLKSLTDQSKYLEITKVMSGVQNVLEPFENYKDIPRKKRPGIRQLAEACLVVGHLDSRVQSELLKWVVEGQLVEYKHLFGENQDVGWLDKIDRRFAWFKKFLLDFEEQYGRIFPPSWNVSEHMAVGFCEATRNHLQNAMSNRKQEIDVKLLLFAIQKTIAFEQLLEKRFGSPEPASNPFEEPEAGKNPFGEESEVSCDSQKEAVKQEKQPRIPFPRMISGCFENFLFVYVEGQDKNLTELINQFQIDIKSQGFPCKRPTSEESSLTLSNAADLFLFFKKCMVQCTQLTRGQPLLSLSAVFQKHLRDYANKILQANLPRPATTASSLVTMSSLTKDFREMSTQGLIQNFSNLLKDSTGGATEVAKFSREEICRICSVLATTDYCLETCQQMEIKLKEKLDPVYRRSLDYSSELDVLNGLILTCMQLLVQDLDNQCEPKLSSMSKVAWSNVHGVGDQSQYVSGIEAVLKQNVPLIRDCLGASRRFFLQLCTRFANVFIPKFVQQLFKCKPLGTLAAEQLLLDTHMLKELLLNLPVLECTVVRKAPSSYTRIVLSGMGKAEILLKVAMTPTDNQKKFVEQYVALMPESADVQEFHRILEMKGAKRAEISQLSQQFQALVEERSKQQVVRQSSRQDLALSTGSSETGFTFSDGSVEGEVPRSSDVRCAALPIFNWFST